MESPKFLEACPARSLVVPTFHCLLATPSNTTPGPPPRIYCCFSAIWILILDHFILHSPIRTLLLISHPDQSFSSFFHLILILWISRLATPICLFDCTNLNLVLPPFQYCEINQRSIGSYLTIQYHPPTLFEQVCLCFRVY